MADVAGVKHDHRVRVIHQHGKSRNEAGEAGTVASDTIVPDAVLCIKFFGAGERAGIRADFFAEPGGDTGGGGAVRVVVRDSLRTQAATPRGNELSVILENETSCW